MSDRIDRRSSLRRSLLASAAPSSNTLEVFAAAHELRRAGGRVLTLRDFADGLYADAGAARKASAQASRLRGLFA